MLFDGVLFDCAAWFGIADAATGTVVCFPAGSITSVVAKSSSRYSGRCESASTWLSLPSGPPLALEAAAFSELPTPAAELCCANWVVGSESLPGPVLSARFLLAPEFGSMVCGAARPARWKIVVRCPSDADSASRLKSAFTSVLASESAADFFCDVCGPL